MKKLAIYTALAAVAAGMSSCNDFLDDNRYPMSEQYNTPTYWSNEPNLIKQTDNLYTNFTGYGSSTNGLFYFKTLSDNQGSGTGGGFTNWTFTNVPTASTLWQTPYEVIRQCNYVINYVPIGTLDPDIKAKYIGIARLIRAQQYFQLVRAYGDVPYLDFVPEPTQAELAIKPSSRDLIMDKVYEDLDYAAKNIGNGTRTTWSSDLAYAMMSEICLFEGTFCKYRTLEENYKAPDTERAKTFLERAAAAAKVLIDKTGTYSLNSSYIANYNSVSLEGNPEMIFYKAYKQSTLTHQTIQYTCRTTTIAGLSKDAFDSYLFKNGKPLSKQDASLKNDAGYIKNGIVTGTGEKAVIGKILYIGDLLKERDARLAQTIDTVVAFGTTNAGMTWARSGSDQLSSSTGYLIRKFDNPEEISWTYRQGSNYTCAPVYWLAVVYLDYAEAKAELEELGKGTFSEDDFNATLAKLYKRAEIENIDLAALKSMNDDAKDADVSSLLWEIRRCRRSETMLDNDYRYWDLVRWHKLDKLDTTKNPNIRLGANLADVKNEFADDPTDKDYFEMPTYSNMEGKYMQAIPGNNRVFAAREYFYPIPSDQIMLSEFNGTQYLTQQPLWK